MKNSLWQPLRVKTLVFCPFDCPWACWFTKGWGLTFTSARVLVRALVGRPSSHMKQDMDISLAPPHLSAPIPLFEYRSL